MNSMSNATVGSQRRMRALAFISFLAIASLLTTTVLHFTSSSSPLCPLPSPLPPHLFDALVHYALVSNASSSHMHSSDLLAISAVLRRRTPCNLLVFGLGPETLLWRALNHGGRTVFLDENEYFTSLFEQRHPGLEAYDVAYTTKVSEFSDLLSAVRAKVKGECRPVQNLLFSDCRLAINDLPNQLYDVAWDVIVIDGPSGYSPASPGRASAIFTAAVMARSQALRPTEVLVHDYERELERVFSDEFLCAENMVGTTGKLAHFVVQPNAATAAAADFCVNHSATSSPADIPP
ncbi:hypothetical protein J5N97_002217 [Dioscorea zingiberensis]|uniref:Polysaccharide biosynthesis domain-containing protein n=1 Tax=Dioscorea zingiberensis TaxID=325984 RepID=A0A9D5D2B1_9LILI|nr:hypothetical protein J5N97_002217 [Dioscorea zingiberensis]